MNYEESAGSDDSDSARRTRRESLHSSRQLLVELLDNPMVKEFQKDLLKQMGETADAVFLPSDKHDVGTLIEREQLIGQRRGLETAAAWLEGRLIEIDAELTKLEKTHVPDS